MAERRKMSKTVYARIVRELSKDGATPASVAEKTGLPGHVVAKVASHASFTGVAILTKKHKGSKSDRIKNDAAVVESWLSR